MPKRFVIIDLLRSFAILAVLALHTRDSRVAFAPGPGAIGEIWDALSQNGIYGVTIFFVISGFLISMMTAARHGSLFQVRPRDFYVRRAARILPLLGLTLLLGLLVVSFSTASGQRLEFTMKNPRALFDAPFWASIFTFTFNLRRVLVQPFSGLHWDVLWSLAIEEQFYLCFPLVMLWTKRKQRLIPLLVAVFLAGIGWRLYAYLVHPGEFFLLFFFSPAGFDGIALGCLAYLASESLAQTLVNSASARGLLLTVGFAMLSGAYLGLPLHQAGTVLYVPTLISLGTALMLVAARFSFVPLNHSRLARLLVLPGHLSYGMYLLHPVSLFLFWPFLARLKRVVAVFPIYCLLTLLLGYVVYRLYEQPANRYIRRRLLQAAAGE